MWKVVATLEKLKRKKNKSEKEISEVKEKSEPKQKKEKSVALSKEEKKAKKEKSASASETKAVEKASNEKDKSKKISWNPFSKDNMYALKIWLQSLKSEFNKIIWPTKPQLLAYTVVVLATLISVSIYLFFLGKIFEFLFKQAGIV